MAALLTAAATAAGPRYDAQGNLMAPSDYREWVYMSTGLDMSYVEGAAADHSMFDNVFVEPGAWAAFKKTGHWPDGTILALEVRGATTAGSINKRGRFQVGEPMGLEFHVLDATRFKGGWAFFVLGEGSVATKIPESAECYACHKAHGAVDTTFVQFYPTARAIAEKAGTFRAD
jgi:hypothetical protein